MSEIWSDDRIDALRRLAGEGASLERAAAAIGVEIPQAQGKARRLGLVFGAEAAADQSTAGAPTAPRTSPPGPRVCVTWSEDDDATLRRLAATEGYRAAAAALGRTIAACQQRGSRLGLLIEGGARRSFGPWSPEEDATLRDLGAREGFPAVAAALGRTLAAVRQRAKQIGFQNGRGSGPAGERPAAAAPDDSIDVGTPAEGWSDRRMAALETLAAQGLSASEIQKRLGLPTRNAVIGKVARMGLRLGVGNAARPERPKHGEPSRGPTKAKADREREAARRQIEAAERAQAADAKRREAAERIEALKSLDAGKFPHACGIMDLRPASCRFPLFSDPDVRTARYCGAARQGVAPYCPGHAALTYAPSRERAAA